MRTVKGDAHTQEGRLRKAEQFASAATIVSELAGDDDDLNDAVVTLCVHAGIAAADVVCIRSLGVHAAGQNHQDAIQLLRKVDVAAANHLNKLLSLKTRAGYSHVPATSEERKQAERAMNALVEAAR